MWPKKKITIFFTISSTGSRQLCFLSLAKMCIYSVADNCALDIFLEAKIKSSLFCINNLVLKSLLCKNDVSKYAAVTSISNTIVTYQVSRSLQCHRHLRLCGFQKVHFDLKVLLLTKITTYLWVLKSLQKLKKIFL